MVAVEVLRVVLVRGEMVGELKVVVWATAWAVVKAVAGRGESGGVGARGRDWACVCGGSGRGELGGGEGGACVGGGERGAG